MLTGTPSEASVIERLTRHIENHVEKDQAQDLVNFSRKFYGTISSSDLESRSINNLYGAVYSLWGFIYDRATSEFKVRVYNPSIEQHGWESPHTIIEIVCNDMPFIVDSVRMEVNRLGVLCHLTIHTGCFCFQRNKAGELIKVSSEGDNSSKSNSSEAVIFMEIDRQIDSKVLGELHDSLIRILKDVSMVVNDWKAMCEVVRESIAKFEFCPKGVDEQELEESKDFLSWLLDNNFTFLGSRDYKVVGKGDKQALQIISETGLGVLRDHSHSQVSKNIAALPPKAQEMMLSPQALIIAKTNTPSTVHRPSYTDYIGIKQFNEEGVLIGFRLVVGLYTSTAYSSNPRYIPLIRHKVEKVLIKSQLDPRGHAGKALIHIIENLPRDDLIQASIDELFELCVGILHLQERQRTRLFIRKDHYNRFHSCLVYVPRECFNTRLRKKIQAILVDALGGTDTEFALQFDDSILARIHFLIRVDSHEQIPYDIKSIEKEVIVAARMWTDDLKDQLVQCYGEGRGLTYYSKYKEAFLAVYKESYSAETALIDIEHIEKLDDVNRLEIGLHQDFEGNSSKLQLKLFTRESMTPISDVLPILEHMGLRVITEQPNVINFSDESRVYINDFQIVHVNADVVDVNAIRELFKEAFSKIWFGEAESDAFNRLIIESKLSWRQTALLRAYSRYFKQVGTTFSQAYISIALFNNPEITKKLIELFHLRFDPLHHSEHLEQQLNLSGEIEEGLDLVESLDEDRILRRMLSLMQATIRTNYFVNDENGDHKAYTSFKLDPMRIADMPLPKPMFEIFVYSPRVEGVHLRGAKVARGGLRWSDRQEDYRTEVLGLMKAQQVKNAVIVPLGAKGGFVAKKLPTSGSREEVMKEVIVCYQNFIRGLLDVTDNIVNGKVIVPESVVRYDGDDPYLVVAADKGTTTFSDIANAISKKYNFWLGDAFASGGSAGYDHKKMGITARGAWESTKRHFKEMGVDTQTTPFTVIGIGDMSGDVFGNGMLLSRHIKLVAAFNHLDIFIDPDPDPEVSFKERERLFKLPRCSWSDYDPKLISSGGGVFRRSDKSISLTESMRALLDVEQEELTPNELIKALLQSRVDLFWNGGIGTFLKASDEQHSEAGDRANDAIRVNADELNCKVVVEGGNLGFTQKARIEYAQLGGRINADFIDNSAGVDCSDHEVNIKILLNSVVASGKMTVEERNVLLAEMSDEVAELVLKNNYLQVETLSLEEHSADQTINLFRHYILYLEKQGRLDRAIEFLPSDEELLERKARGLGFARPEIAILMAYDKTCLKEEIMASTLPEDPYFQHMLESAFPRCLSERFKVEMQGHSLRREIISTQLSNSVTNCMGINFVTRLAKETGAPTASIVKAYVVAQEIFDLHGMWDEIRALDANITTKVIFSMMLQLYFLIRRSTRWILRNYSGDVSIDNIVARFGEPLSKLREILTSSMNKRQMGAYRAKVKGYVGKGVSKALAQRVSRCVFMFHSLDILQSSLESDLSLQEVAKTYFTLSNKLRLNWLREKMISYAVENHWDELARSLLLDDLDYQQRLLTLKVLQFKKPDQSIEQCYNAWCRKNRGLFERWNGFLADVLGNENAGYTMYCVLMRELSDLAHAEVT